MTENEISKYVVNCAIEVHHTLGPGLLESIYEHCLAHELKEEGLEVTQQMGLPVSYKETKLDLGYRLDLWINKKVI